MRGQGDLWRGNSAADSLAKARANLRVPPLGLCQQLSRLLTAQAVRMCVRRTRVSACRQSARVMLSPRLLRVGGEERERW